MNNDPEKLAVAIRDFERSVNHSHGIDFMNPEQAFVNLFDQLARDMNKTAHEKGWYESEVKNIILNHHDEEAAQRALKEFEQVFNGNRHALMASEISESLENLRAGETPDDKIPEFTGTEAELADTIIRIMDYAAENNLRVGEAIIAKAVFNKSRPYKHGKKF